MIILVERCWAGKDIYHRVTVPGSRANAHLNIRRETWDRQAAKEALDILENAFHIPRRNVRFSVR